jgi:hypothetical protein
MGYSIWWVSANDSEESEGGKYIYHITTQNIPEFISVKAVIVHIKTDAVNTEQNGGT